MEMSEKKIPKIIFIQSLVREAVSDHSKSIEMGLELFFQKQMVKKEDKTCQEEPHQPLQ